MTQANLEGQPTCSYKRRKLQGVLTLTGICDIFDAATAHGVAVKALADSAVQEYALDCKNLERIDMSVAQVLFAFMKDAESAGKRITVLNLPDSVNKYLQSAGMKLAS